MPSAPSQLTIRLFGTPTVTVADGPLPLTGHKAHALLYYLAASGQPYTRDHLAALLWGDAPLSSARHSLRSALHRMRQALRDCHAEDCLRADEQRLALDPRRIFCDLARFHQCIADGSEPALHEAVALVRGPLLQGFSLPDATLFDEFVQLEESRLTRSYLAALDRLTTLAEQRAEWEPAIAYAQRSAQIDPLAEAAQQRLMALYVRSGSPGLAQRHYQSFERVLRHELDLAPAPQTRAIVRAEAEVAQLVQHRPKAQPFVARPSSLPFVGRNLLLAELSALGQRAATERGAALIIEGEAGIGKSRLVDELINTLRADLAGGRAWTMLQGRCSPYDSILAYGPFREAFRELLPERPEAAAGLPQPGFTAADQFAGLVLRALEALAERGPVLLAIDDLHSADAQTLELFGYLALHLRRLPLLLIGTAQRSADLPALHKLIALGRRRDDLGLLALQPLGQQAIEQLLASQGLAAIAAASLGPWLQARSAGNPFVIESLVMQLQAEAIVLPHAMGWQLDSQRWISWRSTAALPTSTYDLVTLQLGELSPPARQLVELLAVAGGPLPPPLISVALASPPPGLDASIEELLRLGMAIEQGAALALPHPLLREAALHQLSGMARRRLHQRLAEAWEQHTPADRQQIARHAVAGGDVARARRDGLALLRDLPYSYAGSETIAFLQQLHELVAPLATDEELRRLSHALGQAHRSLGQVEAARGWQQRELGLAQASGLSDAEALAYFELAELAFVSTDYTTAAAMARAGLDRAAQLAPEAQLALAGRGHRLLGGALAIEGGDLLAAESHLQAAIQAHRQAGPQANLSAALFELGNVLAQQGSIARAAELYSQAASAIDPDQTPFLYALAQNNLAYHSLLLGQFDQARQALGQGRAAAERHALSGALLHLFSTESEIQLYSGDWDAADAACRHGLALAEQLGNLERQAGYRAGLGLALAGRGQIEAAAGELTAALALIAGRAFWHIRTRILLWLAELWLDRDPAVAGGYLDTALGLARAQRRQLLLLHAERLYALRLAAAGEVAVAQAQLVGLLERGAGLGLGLEVARTRAALARVTLQHVPRSDAGGELLDTALHDLLAYGALAEYLALSRLLRPEIVPR